MITLVTKIWKSGDRFFIPLDEATVQKLMQRSGKIFGKDDVYVKVKIEVIS